MKRPTQGTKCSLDSLHDHYRDKLLFPDTWVLKYWVSILLVLRCDEPEHPALGLFAEIAHTVTFFSVCECSCCLCSCALPPWYNQIYSLVSSKRDADPFFRAAEGLSPCFILFHRAIVTIDWGLCDQQTAWQIKTRESQE